ncbi:PfkB family carbohydrate kinase [Mesorhizobium sp.]|uniref:PfkB family carbohydrate kinase n=1 Tax=Mesorhizobium sp. TaxID=1871066 RepID=UPI000FE92196|nr:PfkB family carbohydrate kinase [Mesorhizobium sp.]RWJ31945.1 MAG: fructoselysine 6-kinase [Mesorhizobium sp.]TIQ73849.1 MAG: fructoselysine 6-kinase [Mesorhizobium sp.]
MTSSGNNHQGLVGIGDNVVDHYLDQAVYYPGGNALNVAVLAHRFGLTNSAYVGILGDDEEGKHVHSSIVAEGLSDSQLRFAKGATGKATVTLVNGDRVFVDSNRGGVRRKLMLRMDEDDLDRISSLGHVHSSCFSYLEPELPRIRAHARGLSFDFSTGRDMAYLAAVCPTITLAFLSASDLSDSETEALMAKVLSLGVPAICVTQGERGAVFSDGRRTIRQGIVQARLVDTMGAGDAFIAGFLAAQIGGASIADALPQAASFAAKACGWPGAFGYPHPARWSTVEPAVETTTAYRGRSGVP